LICDIGVRIVRTIAACPPYSSDERNEKDDQKPTPGTHDLLTGSNRSMFGIECDVASEAIVPVSRLKPTLGMNSTRSVIDVLSS
jgi:hypothetical protein